MSIFLPVTIEKNETVQKVLGGNTITCNTTGVYIVKTGNVVKRVMVN